MTSEACVASRRAPTTPALELADIVGAHGARYRSAHALTPEQSAVLRDIVRCRTAALGGHLEVCDACGHSAPVYNSCRNRHCPKCQSSAATKWIEARVERVLPTHYFHTVFTLPAELRGLAMHSRRLVFDMMFEAASATLLELGRDPKRLGARLGVTMVLHTWARDLTFHPHLHCIVTGGGLSFDGARWISCRDQFLFPVEVMAALFRGKLLAALSRAHARGQLDLGEAPVDPEGFDRLCRRLYKMRWHVYAKRPFGGPEQVIRYLGRYTHRVGISNSRLVSMDTDSVTFRTKDGQQLTVPPQTFLSRFLQHVLPRGFVKIRHYGLMAPTYATTALPVARELLIATSALPTPPTATAPPLDPSWRTRCPDCGMPALRRLPLPTTNERAPP